LILIGCTEPDNPIALQSWATSLDLTLGSEQDDRYAFHQIAGVARDRQGRIYVADAGESVIRVYSDSGQHIRDIGRSGEGPGEFRQLLGIGFVFDTLYAIDGRTHSVSYFDTVGLHLRTLLVASLIGGPGTVSRVLANGRAVVIPSVHMEAAGLVPRLLASVEGRKLDTLDYISVGEGALRIPLGRGYFYTRDPFAQPRFLPLHQSGEWWIEVTQYPDAPHSPGEFSLTRRSVAGDSLWSKTFSQEPVDFPADSVDQIVDAMIEASRLPIPGTDLRAALRPPAYFYAVDRVIVSDAGDIWLRVRNADGRAWLVLDDDGEPIGTVKLPDNAAPREIIGRESLIVVWTNDLGVETVRRYRLTH